MAQQQADGMHQFVLNFAQAQANMQIQLVNLLQNNGPQQLANNMPQLLALPAPPALLALPAPAANDDEE